ncbi:MAG: WXG100 family type VII secretion target [Anaerolineales bacterium]|nr:WXG100 family type VII secretion target [Anaerolineales bacterium]
MSDIHVEPEELRQTSRLLQRGTLDMLDMLDRMRSHARRLEMSWIGGSAGEFHGELEYLLRRLITQADELHLLGTTLQRQADRWEESDFRWAAEFAQLTRNR